MKPHTRSHESFGSRYAAIFILVAALVLAVGLRFVDIGTRPMHADEGVQAFIFAEKLETGNYRYDPAHYHGPLPHFLNVPLMRVLGVKNLDTLQAWQFRVQPVLAGVLLVVLAVLCAGGDPRMRWRAAMLAGVSPLLVYFGRMAIHETLFACCALAAPFSVAQWLATRRVRWLFATAIALGCLHATKETWCIVAFSWAVAVLMLCPAKAWRALRKAGALGLAFVAVVALAVSFWFYSDGGKHPAGFLDAWRTLFVYRTGGGHEQRWHYFFKEILFFFPVSRGVWGEGVVVLFAMAACAFAFLRRKMNHAHRHVAAIPMLPRVLALAAAVQIVVYSFIKYKTPWLMLAPVASLVPLAAHGWAQFCEKRNRVHARGAWTCTIVCGMLVVFAGAQTVQSSFKRATDSQIPFVYAPTLPEADARLIEIAKALPADALVAVIGGDYWPLPWYFRACRERVGFFSIGEEPADLREFALVMHAGYEIGASSIQTADVVLELRPGYFVSVSKRAVGSK